MKVIDLLNKIANGEEVPKKVKYYDVTYEYVDYNNDFNKYRGIEHITIFLFDIIDNLNDEVEIIEEDKKIPTLKNLNLTKIDINKKGQVYGVTTKEMIADIQTLQNWINKVIDYINKEK